MNRLILRYRSDPLDEIALLHATLETDDFRGAGTAWASSAEFEALAHALARYPFQPDDPPTMRLGYNKLAGDDLLVGVTVRPENLRGELRVLAEIASHLRRVDRVRASFSTHYADVERFQRALTRLAKGEIEEAVLEGS